MTATAPSASPPDEAPLGLAHRRFLDWLNHQAYPLWGSVGVDVAGPGFFEKIDPSGHPLRGQRRARVLGRQIYAFSQAGRLGWEGPWRDIVQHGLDRLPLYLREDGLARSRVEDDGAPVDGPPDLYDQAFILFGAAAAFPHAGDPEALARTASRLREALYAALGHGGGGFEETAPPTVPLKANPHMHLLESALAWAGAPGRPDGEAWDRMADDLAELALRRFIDPETGAVHEWFDADWGRLPIDGAAPVEPGHQFEWGWLLTLWAEARGRADALEAGRRLIELAEARGVDPARNLTFGGLDAALGPVDETARLWAQTERIKAWVQTARRSADPVQAAAAEARAARGVDGLFLYMGDSRPGAWIDHIGADGAPRIEPAPASSLYHIVCAASELEDWAQATDKRA